jgi:CO/xanthine dehydrogenase Mo-binding subunit
VNDIPHVNIPAIEPALAAGSPGALGSLPGPPAIGAALPRADAFDKVTGRAKFASDYYSASMLLAGVKRAGVPHGKLKHLHTADAMSLPGVIAVLTAHDVPGENRLGVIKKDQPLLVDDTIRHRGDALALVLAHDCGSLKKALACITFDYEPLPGVFDMEEALKPGAPLVHADNPGGNLLLGGGYTCGSPAAALGECAVVNLT